MRPLLVAALLTCVLALPARGQAPPKPITTFQTQPINRLLTGVRQLFTRLGDAETARKFEAEMVKTLGPEGLAGLNLDRPITGYQVVNAKSEEPSFVVLVPVTSKEAAPRPVQARQSQLRADAGRREPVRTQEQE